MGVLQTEFDFVLPKGFIDSSGTLHRRGTMRLATARDEIEPLRDPRVSDSNDPFLTVIVLSRVITQLGTLSQVTPREIEGLFAADLAFLQDFYGIINFGDPAELRALQASVDPGAGADAPAPGDDTPATTDDAPPAAEARAPRARGSVEEVRSSPTTG
ncbi:MAG TPA: hypothetical protein VK866_14945 [Acidimicrobiales bacterium]|nr:hypothetical protein [Acidimicrobiales bacterium]